MARAVAAVLLAMPHLLVAQQQPFVERVDVARVLIDVRVFDDKGRPVAGLEPSDFVVEIDGMPVRVESAEWIGGVTSAEPTVPSPGDRAANPRDGGRRGRLIVLLVQKSLEPVRIVGLMRMLQLVEPLFQQLTPDDRVALLSFDSHLKIWTDFTGDLDHVRSLIREDVLLKHPSPVEAAADASIVSRFDQKSGKKVYSIEHALRRIGEALEPLPGTKSIVVLGYGFGRFNPSTGGVTLMDGYEEASAALQRARAAVFTLNVTQANYNSLQAGLQAVAAETGGFYASTYEFPVLAMRRLVHALEGHYVLFVDRPLPEARVHRIEVRLNGKKGSVFARATYVD